MWIKPWITQTTGNVMYCTVCVNVIATWETKILLDSCCGLLIVCVTVWQLQLPYAQFWHLKPKYDQVIAHVCRCIEKIYRIRAYASEKHLHGMIYVNTLPEMDIFCARFMNENVAPLGRGAIFLYTPTYWGNILFIKSCTKKYSHKSCHVNVFCGAYDLILYSFQYI